MGEDSRRRPKSRDEQPRGLTDTRLKCGLEVGRGLLFDRGAAAKELGKRHDHKTAQTAFRWYTEAVVVYCMRSVLERTPPRGGLAAEQGQST
ncbi:hypothetical protein NDU88_002688 [Pleurodeles waltl]|uniref:Uncharacterized protein n=1 Tax=Pleurodeles waltl TaxID=8319 RepID=A0AAV7TLW9_PLEWA|nr:hypothetical protein NDU88_002688 [Pleurodeles waltl]